MSPTKPYKALLSLSFLRGLFKRTRRPANARPKGRVKDIPDYLRKDLGLDPVDYRPGPTHPPRDPPVKDPFSLK